MKLVAAHKPHIRARSYNIFLSYIFLCIIRERAHIYEKLSIYSYSAYAHTKLCIQHCVCDVYRSSTIHTIFIRLNFAHVYT